MFAAAAGGAAESGDSVCAGAVGVALPTAELDGLGEVVESKAGAGAGVEVAGTSLLAGVLVPRTVGVVLLVGAWATGLDPPTDSTKGGARLIEASVLDATTS
jgi:hypothetical protein